MKFWFLILISFVLLFGCSKVEDGKWGERFWKDDGYFVCGCGDAVGEPVGARWGKHTYRVPSLLGIKVIRSIEGSIGVLVVGFAAACIALLANSYDLGTALFVGAICGAVGALVEAFSTHGFDNVTIQVVVSGVAYFLLH